jgi:hypothetical protein
MVGAVLPLIMELWVKPQELWELRHDPDHFVGLVENDGNDAQVFARDAGYRTARARIVREEDWAQETQRNVRDDDIGLVSPRANIPPPTRPEKLYLVGLSRAPRGLHRHMLEHAILQACAEDLNNAGRLVTLPTGGAIFVSPEHYIAALAAAEAAFGEAPLLNRDIVVTRPFKEAVKQQIKTARRALDNNGQVKILSRRLLGVVNEAGVELRTASSQSDHL